MSGDNYLAEYQRGDAAVRGRGWMGRVRSYLDRKAVEAGQIDRHALFMPRVLELTNISPDRPVTVLEIGCGSGWAISYRHPSIRYIAIDRGSVYRASLEECGIEFHEFDVSDKPLPLADGTVDVVLLIHLIEHIPHIEAFTQELRRILRPHGCIYIRTPNVARVKWRFWDDFTHVRPFTPNSLDHLMRTYGFQRRFLFASDHPRIMLDILTNGRMRAWLFSEKLGGKEIEAGYACERNE